ncbi:hypothetical protein DFH05DRAFT_1584945 [Lentinula detonsa]|uniref:Uncharacterized protein n=1 Tax=Lentinula detonsa TaxID=2804962 RepID=A0A9W8TTL6_9AGAR|nr:hypothetical protein DFH05DRAFT_1584945 [Lentinula detonsa]
MANRLEFDPALMPCPDFTDEFYGAFRNSLIIDPNHAGITDDQGAANHLREQWEVVNTRLREQYQAQMIADQEDANRRREEADEVQRQREAEDRERLLEQTREVEKKRIPAYSFVSGEGAHRKPLRIHPYAEKLMAARKYVPLWYFLPDAALEAKERAKEVMDTNHFQIANEGGESSSGALVLVGTHSIRASPNAIPDTRLTWSQVILARGAFLKALSLGDWPNEHVKMFAEFFACMDTSEELNAKGGVRALVLYQAEMRLDWFKANERQKPYDLAVTNTEVLEDCWKTVRREEFEKTLKGMDLAIGIDNLFLTNSTGNPPPLPPPRLSNSYQTTRLTHCNHNLDITYPTHRCHMCDPHRCRPH